LQIAVTFLLSIKQQQYLTGPGLSNGGCAMRVLTIVVASAWMLFAQVVFSQVPPLMNYQGVLTDAEGAAVPDNDYGITFRLYAEDTGGDPIWEESQTVPVTRGIFNAVLGKTYPLELSFETMYWLAISIEGGDELTPRVPLVSVPYCLNARGVQDNAITNPKIADGAVTAGKISDGQIVRAVNGLQDEVQLTPGANINITPVGQQLVISATGAGGGDVSGSGQSGQVAFWNGTSSIDGDDWLYWDAVNRHLGIGDSNPDARLRVASDEQFCGIFASTYRSDTTEVFRANYLGGGQVDAVAVKGISLPDEGFGVGGEFNGGHKGLVAAGNGGNTPQYVYGVHATAVGSTASQSYRYGIWASAYGPSTGNNLGVVGEAYGEGHAAVGVYGVGSGNDKAVFGVYGEVNGYGSEARYAFYGETFGAGDSVYAGYFDGNLVYTGSFYKLSDRMFKTDITPCEGALAKVLALQPKKYRYDKEAHKGVSLPRGEHYGLIAQEVEEVLPELVGDLYHAGKPRLNDDEPAEESFGYKGINYTELIPILVQAIKEQQRTIDEMKNEIAELKKR